MNPSAQAITDSPRTGSSTNSPETASSTARSDIYPGLDVLRGWGAIAIVFYHSNNLLGLSLFKSCYLAVDMFFVTSGFIVAHAYDRRIPSLGILGFLRVRLIRFYPLLLLGISIGFIEMLILIVFNHSPYTILNALVSFVCNFLFLPSPPYILGSTAICPLDGPSYTMVFEMAINVVYVFLFRWLSIRVLIVIVAVALAGLCLSLSTYHWMGPGAQWTDIWGGVARVCFSFPLGVLLYRLRLPSPKLGFLVLPGLLALLCLGGSPAIDLIMVVLGIPALILIAAHATPRWAAVTSYLAATSYCIYAIHFPIIILMNGVSHRAGLSTVWTTMATIAVLLVLSPLLDRWYDRPVRRWLGAHVWRPRQRNISRPESSKRGADLLT